METGLLELQGYLEATARLEKLALPVWSVLSGCEKSCKPVEFRDFLRQEGTVKDVRLVPFKGNRFNVLFHNAAGLFYLLQDVLTFTSRQRDSNNLFKAIKAIKPH